MSQNGSGPETSTAVVEDGAREVDQLDGSIASENNIIVILPQAALISRIKAHIAAGDKATGIGKSRTYELLAIAAGTKTVEQVRDQTNVRKIKHRQSVRSGTDNADDPEASAEAMKAKFTTFDGDEKVDGETAEGEPFVDNPDDKEMQKRRAQFLKAAGAALGYGQVYDEARQNADDPGASAEAKFAVEDAAEEEARKQPARRARKPTQRKPTRLQEPPPDDQYDIEMELALLCHAWNSARLAVRRIFISELKGRFVAEGGA